MEIRLWAHARRLMEIVRISAGMTWQRLASQAVARTPPASARGPRGWLPTTSVFPTPLPVAHLRQILAMFGNVLLVLDALVTHSLLGIGHAGAELRHAIDDILYKMEAVEIIQDHHVKGGGGGPFFLVAAHMQVGMVGATVSQAVDKPGIPMESKDDRLIRREQHVEGSVTQAVRMF